MRFLSFPIVEEPVPVELAIGEGRTVKVEIPGNELSPPYKADKGEAGNKAVGQVELYFNMDNQARPFFTST